MVFLPQLFHGFGTKTAWMRRVVLINLLRHLVAGNDQLVSVRDYHVIAWVSVRLEINIGLSNEVARNISRKTAEDFPGCVYGICFAFSFYHIKQVR